MKLAISRRIASLLLLFNLTSVSALVSVSLLIARRPAEDELRSATSRQARIAKQLATDFDLRGLQTGGFENLQRVIEDFDSALFELRNAARAEAQIYGHDASVMQGIADLDKRWTALKPDLLNSIREAGGRLKVQIAAVVEASRTLNRSVGDAWRQRRNERITYILSGALFLNLLLSLFYMWSARRSIVTPVQDLLHASEDRYRLLFNSNPSPIFIFDMETLRFLEVNQAAIDHYGYTREEFLAKTILEIRPEEETPELMATLKTGQSSSTGRIWRHKKRDGTIFPARVVSHNVVFESRRARLATIYDMSEQERLEEQLRQSQKVEAIGRLSGGIAHDFNNLLTVISGNIALALEDGVDSKTQARIDEIQKAADRAGSLTRQLLAFSRKQVMQLRVVNPNTVVKNSCEMLGRLIRESIQLRTFLSSDVGTIRVDPTQMEQVLVNLAVNARDAMPGGGTLTVKTERVYLEKHPGNPDPQFTPGHYVLVSVEDTGCGMDEKTLNQMFDPFFTTKPIGSGTGLGLSTVYGIVRQSSGIITVDSEPGKGTQVHIYLPNADAPTEPAKEIRNAPKAASENILLVEDDDVVREITTEGLKRHGYRVSAVKDADSALEICRRNSPPVNLLLTDMIMPGMNGAQLAQAVKETRSDLGILCMSGYTDNALKDCQIFLNDIDLIHKPFTFEQLHEKIRNVLSRSAAHNAY